jgi:hypothetical protein
MGNRRRRKCKTLDFNLWLLYESAGSEDGSKSDGFPQRPFEPLGVLGPTQV